MLAKDLFVFIVFFFLRVLSLLSLSASYYRRDLTIILGENGAKSFITVNAARVPKLYLALSLSLSLSRTLVASACSFYQKFLAPFLVEVRVRSKARAKLNKNRQNCANK